MNKILLWAMLFLAVTAARADEPARIPTEIHTRLWETPGPQQDEAGAPRLLLVYPSAGAEPFEAEHARYGGRVEPAGARVTLNGTALAIQPGGVFTGIKALPEPGQSATWTFKATAKGKSTVITRTVRRWSPPPPAPESPLSFWAAPVAPTGQYWLPAGGTLDLKLYASPEAKAEYRIGDTGPWQPLEGKADAVHGGIYTATLTAAPEPAAATPQLKTVHFRLTRGENEKQLTSRLKVGTLPAGRTPVGEILLNRVTFLKNPTGWDRWGNWSQGTRFPVLEQRGERFKTSFGPAGGAYVDDEDYTRVKLDLDSTSQPLIRLGPCHLERPTSETLVLRWPDVHRPLPFRAFPLPEPGTQSLTLELFGVDAQPRLRDEFSSGPIQRYRLSTPMENEPARLLVDLNAPLWGYDVNADTSGGLTLLVRTKPRPRNATPQRPLAGLRIMLDPGHGGKDLGAIGPSGLCEADLNLVQAGYTEAALKKLGATVYVTRRDDTFIELDDRVQLGLDWHPDLFVTLHHNSIGGESDPTLEAGPKVFTHYATAQAVASSISAKLGAAWGAEVPVLPHIARVIRNQTACPTVLVESAYVSNPKDEIRLRRTATLKQTGEAIAAGIAAIWR
jgi:N-acetylmuramoyl-L-alanine amidase